MSRSLALFAIGTLFGATAGFLTAASYGVTLDGHDHGEHLASTHSDTHHNMKHDELLAVSQEQAPELALSLIADPMSGWNLQIETTKFFFAPQNASKPHIDGEGHAHIYINGEKVARHYSNWYHIAQLPSGENTIKVSLNSNDHRQLAIGDKPIEQSLIIKVD